MQLDRALEKDLASEKLKEARLERVAQIEDRIFEICAGVAEANVSFFMVDPDQTEPPPEWVEQYGLEGARQRLIVAKYGHLPANEQPSGVRNAIQIMNGISRGRGFRVRLNQTNLNVKISLPAPTSAAHPGPEVYPSRELEE